jgi:DMSO/TMAO reductase YedYZ molybdopterin-dependent catalytic subunit
MTDEHPRDEMPPPRPNTEVPPPLPIQPPQIPDPDLPRPSPDPDLPPQRPDPDLPPQPPEPQPPERTPEPAAEAHAPTPDVPATLAHAAPVLEAPRATARASPIAERPEVAIEVPRKALAAQTRRDFLLFGVGVAAAALGAWWLLPNRTQQRLLPGVAGDRLDTIASRIGLSRDNRELALNGALTFDDDIAEALYSKNRRVRTYERSERTAIRNNYHGRTPGPEILPGWGLTLSGLASGRDVRLTLPELLARFRTHEQVTRLVCVEGWSAIAWWGGIRFAELLAQFPPAPDARWAALRSMVSLDGHGRPEPYYVSIDLGTARHPQTLLATHQDGRPLTLAHGAPLRLLAPMKLGLKNIKAITDIAYTPNEPPDYWNEQGYSKYDGL